MLAGTGGNGESGTVHGCGGGEAGTLQHQVGQRTVVVIASQRRITACGHHFENALGESQDGNVEGTATEVEDRIDAFAGIVEAVGNGGCGGFVDETQDVQASQLGSILGGLALCVIEIGWHRDDGAVELGVEGVFGTLAQGGQDFRTDLDGGFVSAACADVHHALVRVFGHQLVVQGMPERGLDVAQAASHHPLDGNHRVQGVFCQMLQGFGADLSPARGEIAHGRGQNDLALRIGQAFGHAMPHGRDEGMRGAQINAYRDAPFVRVRSLSGFGNL